MNDLLFLISQPRAGSTFTQRMLARHPDIYTLSEPWLMLAPVYAMRDRGYKAEYGDSLARVALQDFLTNLPAGEDDYWHGVSLMASYLYSRAMQGREERVFLDKTPRYYYIIESLAKIFPEAKQLILIRHPIAVLFSFLETWASGDLSKIRYFRDDLLLAPSLIAGAAEQHGPNRKVVRFEKLVASPAIVFAEIIGWMGLDVVAYEGCNKPELKPFKFGDQGLVYRSAAAIPERSEAWKAGLMDPQLWRCAKEYMHMLGPHIFHGLGYSVESLERELHASKPSPFRLWKTKPLAVLLGDRE